MQDVWNAGLKLEIQVYKVLYRLALVYTRKSQLAWRFGVPELMALTMARFGHATQQWWNEEREEAQKSLLRA